MSHAQTLIKEAYAVHRAGDAAGALALYAEAETACADDACRAHCQRHRGDLLRELGRPAEAESVLRQAETIYRNLANDPLSLANTLRLLALVRGDQAQWREARDLYADLGVEAGVRECDSHL